MKDVVCQHKITGEIKTLPEKVYLQVSPKWKFIRYADDSPNEQIQPPKKTEPPVAPAVGGDAGDVKGPVGEVEDITEEEELMILQAQYEELTGKKPGRRTLETLRKEIAELSQPNQ